MVETGLLKRIVRRDQVLQLLADGAFSKPELVDEVDVSRSTVDRAVREFERVGLVTRTDDGYTLSVAGRVAFQSYEQFVADAGDALSAESVLRYLPPDADVDPAVVRGAEVISTQEQRAYLPAKRIETLIESADRIRGVAKAHTQPDSLDIYYREVVQHETEVDLVFQQSLYEQFMNVGDERTQELLDTTNVTAATVPQVPYALFLFTDKKDRKRACLIVYDENAVLRGCLVNDSDSAVSWAEETISVYEARAEPVD